MYMWLITSRHKLIMHIRIVYDNYFILQHFIKNHSAISPSGGACTLGAVFSTHNVADDWFSPLTI